MTNLRWAILAAAFAWFLATGLLPARPAATTRPVTLHVSGFSTLF